jgi:predicted O-linked N-acetylglucosamine transferase (SPINDLY family)
LDGAIAANRRTIEVDPHDVGGHGNLIYALTAHEACDAQTLLAEHRAWAVRHAEPLTAAAAPHAREAPGGRRLRVGYVSAHFRNHAVSFFSEPLIAAHDHERFEIYLYSDVKNADQVTARFQGHADAWRDTAGATDDALAQTVRQDRIDILVDLAGHIGPNRLLVFARKPAPVQVTYLGYQNTTGMSAMDYRLTDAHADPPEMTDPFYTERLVRLPRAFFCYRPPQPAPEVSALPTLASGQITFGSLNQPIKLRPTTWETWARILAAVPCSRLLVLAYPGGQFERRARDMMADRGVDPDRLEVVGRRPRYDYLQLHERIDLALDSFPFNGHTTVCEALWMGVPSIMLEGTSYASRFGGSVLVNLGLEDFLARSVDEYVQIAVAWAGQPERLAELRGTMRERMRASPLVDAAGFARNVEDAYRQMWLGWCQGDI